MTEPCTANLFEISIYALYFFSFILNVIAVYKAWHFTRWYANSIGRALKMIFYSFALLLVIYVSIGFSIIYSQLTHGIVLVPQIDGTCIPWFLLPWILMSLGASVFLWKASTIMEDTARDIITKEEQRRKRKARKSKLK